MYRYYNIFQNLNGLLKKNNESLAVKRFINKVVSRSLYNVGLVFRNCKFNSH